MIDYHAFQQIHHLRDQDKLTLAQIARTLGLHWQTVSKWCPASRIWLNPEVEFVRLGPEVIWSIGGLS